MVGFSLRHTQYALSQIMNCSVKACSFALMITIWWYLGALWAKSDGAFILMWVCTGVLFFLLLTSAADLGAHCTASWFRPQCLRYAPCIHPCRERMPIVRLFKPTTENSNHAGVIRIIRTNDLDLLIYVSRCTIMSPVLNLSGMCCIRPIPRSCKVSEPWDLV